MAVRSSEQCRRVRGGKITGNGLLCALAPLRFTVVGRTEKRRTLSACGCMRSGELRAFMLLF